MSTIAFDQFYLGDTLFLNNSPNGVTTDGFISYTQPLIPLPNIPANALVPAGPVLAMINTLQAQVNALQAQVDNIPSATQNVNIVPGDLPNQYYLRANIGTEQFVIFTTTYVSPTP